MPRFSPAQAVVGAFALAVLAGTLVLMMPVSRAGPGGAPALTALFTATSAVCVTGLGIVDTPTYWSGFGEAAIITMVQIGGFGIMTGASLLFLIVSGRLGIRGRLVAQAETRTLHLGDVRRVMLGVAAFSLLFEAIAATVLTLRLWLGYDYGFGEAAWRGVFHAVSAVNNAGFALWSDSLVGFAGDAWVTLTIALAIIAGGLGFPVWLELGRRPRFRRWSLHAKLTVLATAALVVAGTVALTAAEWSNPQTLGAHGAGGKLLNGFFHAVTPRSAGFNTVPIEELRPESLLFTEILMFIGGGSASTAGGVRLVTFALLILIVLAEVRGRPEVEAFRRRIPPAALRQALSVAVIFAGAVVAGAVALMGMSELGVTAATFESVSAFATAGLSTGVTPALPDPAHGLLVVLMFLGRVGFVTLAVALLMREGERRFRYPEERPLIG